MACDDEVAGVPEEPRNAAIRAANLDGDRDRSRTPTSDDGLLRKIDVTVTPDPRARDELEHQPV